jgi:hypothetical protein
MATKVTQQHIHTMYEMIDEVFFKGAPHSYMDIAKAVGLSERCVKDYFDERFLHNQNILAEKKRLPVDVTEFPMITIVGRREVINGKVCHVYPSRMNF